MLNYSSGEAIASWIQQQSESHSEINLNMLFVRIAQMDKYQFLQNFCSCNNKLLFKLQYCPRGKSILNPTERAISRVMHCVVHLVA